MRVEIRRLLVMSTAHLMGYEDSLEDVLSLANPALMWVPERKEREGIFMWVPEREMDAQLDGYFPPYIKKIMQVARKEHCDYVLFDPDADKVEGLEVFDGQ